MVGMVTPENNILTYFQRGKPNQKDGDVSPDVCMCQC